MTRSKRSPRPRRRVLATAAAAATTAAVLLAGAGTQAASAGPIRAVSLKGVNLRIGGQTDGVRALLVASGVLSGKQYKITYSTFTSGPPLLEALQAGKIDLGGVGNTPPIFAAASRPNFRAVAAIQQRRRHGDYLVVEKDSAIKTLKDLKGKRIAYTRGSSAHGYLVQALARAGLTTKDVQLKDLTPGDSLAAFNSGAVDVWATYEPFVSIANQRTLPDGGGYAASGLSFEVASTKILSNVKTRTAVRDYLVRLRRALAWGATHQDAWAKAFNQESGLPLNFAKEAIAKTLVDVIPATGSVISSEQKLADALAKAGAVKKVSARGFISNQLAG